MSHELQPDPTLIWAPEVIENVAKLELDSYLKFAETACIPGGGCNLDEALNVLYKSQGNVKEAVIRLLKREIKGVAFWTLDEVQLFEYLFRRQPKDFISISRSLKTKSVKDCVEYYYLWKRQHQNLPFSKQEQNQAQIITALQPQHDQHQALILHPEDSSTVKTELPQESHQATTPEKEEFPCKVCGRIFFKIKSRSAHMKRHKNERLYHQIS